MSNAQLTVPNAMQCNVQSTQMHSIVINGFQWLCILTCLLCKYMHMYSVQCMYTAKCTAQNTPIHSFSATVIGRIIITSALAIVFSKQ